MIEVTRLNGSKLMINALLIELLEETPDTLVTMTTGKKMVVVESAAVLAGRMTDFYRSIGLAASSHKSGYTEE
ncbi:MULTISPECIES: flagellar FlbD family protein [Paenibacillus]|uniref:flagellar FlbD family protein n=1 Tax=Paenibacillus TaxID=44249 RepID=UPI00039022B1|nr:MULTISPECIES: flagellar FlbD family protein [Paenibacillus]ASS65711.1 flagellar FlbD family protein [Paenibacillus sp. RUD330]KKC46760.1 flagellar protein D [Paenibacillus sp. D9]CDN42528.1 Flagellar FlbD family protein [Paenibacillus sp. P22]SIQ26605.1 flagellar protein FlbD [Paenibacillus sp. RU4X]SIQ48534.1 flagellar protein FlbD [Paenibacillus sp. RU4T]